MELSIRANGIWARRLSRTEKASCRTPSPSRSAPDIGFHSDSAIYTCSRVAAAQAGKTVNLRINVPSFDAICRMVQCGLGVGLIPDRAFEVIASGMGISAIPLADDWAYRELKIVTRDPLGLSTVTKMLIEHLAQFGRSRESNPAWAATISISPLSDS